jgi:hypothetical protein
MLFVIKLLGSNWGFISEEDKQEVSKEEHKSIEVKLSLKLSTLPHRFLKKKKKVLDICCFFYSYMTCPFKYFTTFLPAQFSGIEIDGSILLCVVIYFKSIYQVQNKQAWLVRWPVIWCVSDHFF